MAGGLFDEKYPSNPQVTIDVLTGKFLPGLEFWLKMMF
jgi:hypothetical protein